MSGEVRKDEEMVLDVFHAAKRRNVKKSPLKKQETQDQENKKLLFNF